MKMGASTYNKLEAAVKGVLAAYPGSHEKYRAAGLSDERWRWDLLHASGFNTSLLYAHNGRPGLNDNHIDTALRQITKDF